MQHKELKKSPEIWQKNNLHKHKYGLVFMFALVGLFFVTNGEVLSYEDNILPDVSNSYEVDFWDKAGVVFSVFLMVSFLASFVVSFCWSLSWIIKGKTRVDNGAIVHDPRRKAGWYGVITLLLVVAGFMLGIALGHENTLFLIIAPLAIVWLVFLVLGARHRHKNKIKGRRGYAFFNGYFVIFLFFAWWFVSFFTPGTYACSVQCFKQDTSTLAIYEKNIPRIGITKSIN